MAKKRSTTAITAGMKVENLIHKEASRKNLPTAEYQSIMQKSEQSPVQVAYERRNRDLDPQLVWRGKDDQDWSDLIVHAPPLYIQEKVHPKALIDDLRSGSKLRLADKGELTPDLFSDFNGIPKGADKTEFYRHDSHWSNRMILGDSLQVMASLAEREGLRGKVQCIYFDPPYGIKFNSNFQWSTRSRDVKDGNVAHITREPEQVKAFRDTWRDGVHSYMTYLRDRLTVARDLLTESGSIFIQIGDENVHRARALMDEVFGEDNFVSTIAYAKTTGFSGDTLSNVADYIVWYAKRKETLKFRPLYTMKQAGEAGATKYKEVSTFGALKNAAHAPEKLVTSDQLTSQGESSTEQKFSFQGKEWAAPKGLHWKTTPEGIHRAVKAERILMEGQTPRYARFLDDFAANPRTNIWLDIGGVQSRTDPKVYVVQTATEAVARCVLMSTDPGDLVLDPTCGSGTTATVSEQWGRRWITIDTSRVALALARSRIMGARYQFYVLADSREGQVKEAQLTQTIPSSHPVSGSIKQGFVYERVPHITLKSIATNLEIDAIWDRSTQAIEATLAKLNWALKQKWHEWDVPREVDPKWPEHTRKLHSEYWDLRINRLGEINKSIAAKAESEFLFDRPAIDKDTVRVAGPFTVESISPHRVIPVDENGDFVTKGTSNDAPEENFVASILEALKVAGVQQTNKEDKISFTSITPWPGSYLCAEGRYFEGKKERRAAIFIGPEFGTVSRLDLVAAAREAGDADFDVLVACAFNFDAHSSDFEKLGRIPVLKARMNADLHMAGELKNTDKGNLFVVFGEPDIETTELKDGRVQVRVRGVDVFHPGSGEVRSDGPEGIACWFIDTDYNEESFFVRHAYFLGANDPYKALKSSLRAEIDETAWLSLNSDTSRPFSKPKSGRIAIKVINHLGDEVMKVFRVK